MIFHNARRRWRSLAALALAGTVLASCGSNEPTATVTEAPTGAAESPAVESPAAETPPAPEGPVTASVGDTVTVNVSSGAGTVVLESVTELPTIEFSRPTNGRWLQVVVVATGTTGDFSINPFDFTARTPDGTAYTFGFYVGEAAEQALQATQLTPGAKARGGIIFDVPVGPVTLEYAPALGLGGVVAAWPL
jgi:Domain of unknown function (DUF4352)